MARVLLEDPFVLHCWSHKVVGRVDWNDDVNVPDVDAGSKHVLLLLALVSGATWLLVSAAGFSR